MFNHVIDDFSLMVDMPKDLINKIAVDKYVVTASHQNYISFKNFHSLLLSLINYLYPRSNPSRGPWTVSLDEHVYMPFLEYCPNRLQRWNVWQGYNGRCSLAQDQSQISNHGLIKELRDVR